MCLHKTIHQQQALGLRGHSPRLATASHLFIEFAGAAEVPREHTFNCAQESQRCLECIQRLSRRRRRAISCAHNPLARSLDQPAQVCAGPMRRTQSRTRPPGAYDCAAQAAWLAFGRANRQLARPDAAQSAHAHVLRRPRLNCAALASTRAKTMRQRNQAAPCRRSSAPSGRPQTSTRTGEYSILLQWNLQPKVD